MKKLLLATAIAALSVSAAHAAPTVYGKAFLTLDYSDFDDKSDTTLNSNSSRIGFKGAEPLTANTDVVYQLEYGIDIDRGDAWVDAGNNTQEKAKSDQFYARDTYLGVSNKQYGTFVAGRLTAIDDQVNYVSQTVGMYDNSFGGANWDGPRANNSMAYFSPSYNDMQFMGMYIMDENDSSDTLLNRDGFGVGVKYEPANQPFRAGATYIQAGDFNTARISGAYDINSFVGLGALYQYSDADANEKENVFSVSGTYKTATPWTAYAQADFIKNLEFVEGNDSEQFVIGGKYSFTKAATGHLYAGYNNYSSDDSEDIDGFGIGTGLEYKF